MDMYASDGNKDEDIINVDMDGSDEEEDQEAAE